MLTEQEELRQATLIAYYGPKQPEFEQFLLRCQDMICETPGLDFRPYDIEQIHATIIGLGKAPGDELFNENMRRYRGNNVIMDIVGFLRYLKASLQSPIRLQFGGYVPDDMPFTSRGQSPYERSFSIQGDKAVLIGWPVVNVQSPCREATRPLTEKMCLETTEQLRSMPGLTNGQPRIREFLNRNNSDAERSLDKIRKRAQAFNILHAYHASESDVDNDFYLRLGQVNTDGLNTTQIHDLNHKVRTWLSESPLKLDLVFDDLMVASYRDEMLPRRSTRQFSLDRINRRKTKVEILYT